MGSQLSAFAHAILAAAPALGRLRVVAIDGPSGAGKTTFAARLAAAIAAAGGVATVVHVDEFLAGWDDLPTMWPRVHQQLLEPLRRGEAGRFQAYDWARGRFAGQWRVVPPTGVLILEGVSSARAAIRPELVASVFLDAPAELCLARAVARDGERLRAPLTRWAAAEAAHFAADGTAGAVTWNIDASHGLPE